MADEEKKTSVLKVLIEIVLCLMIAIVLVVLQRKRREQEATQPDVNLNYSDDYR